MSKSSKANVRCIVNGKSLTYRTPGPADEATVLGTVDLSDLPFGNPNKFAWRFIAKTVQSLVSRTFGDQSPEKAIASAAELLDTFRKGEFPEGTRGRPSDFAIIYSRSLNVPLDEGNALLASKAAKYGDDFALWQKAVRKAPQYLKAEADLMAERAAEAEANVPAEIEGKAFEY